MITKLSEILAGIFIKNHDNIQDAYIRSRYGILEGWMSVVINLILGISKIIVGIISISIWRLPKITSGKTCLSMRS